MHGDPADHDASKPIKVSILTPGVAPQGGLMSVGIPACIVTAYLARDGIVVEKTTGLYDPAAFSIGITKGKWGTLVNTLLDFKKASHTARHNLSVGSLLSQLTAGKWTQKATVHK